MDTILAEGKFGHGALERPTDPKSDLLGHHEEIAGALQPAVWVEKNPQTGFKTYPKRNQEQASDCVIYAMAKALSVDELIENGNWRELSPHSVYPFVVVPGGGSNSTTVAQWVVKKGMSLEVLFPSDGLTETQVESPAGYPLDAQVIAPVYAPGNAVQVATDFETIASILYSYQQQKQNKVVMVTVIGQNNGTWLSPQPVKPDGTGNDYWYHKIAITDFGLINGQKVLSFDNSWGSVGVGNAGQQFLDESYAPFMYAGLYTINQPDNWQALAPSVNSVSYTWNTTLQIGSSGADVLALQQALQSVGMFPVSTVQKPTGYFGGLTRAGVILFQTEFALPVTGIVDAATQTTLNKIFSTGTSPAASSSETA